MDKKFSQLPALSQPLTADLLAILDVANSTTKKVQVGTLGMRVFNVKEWGATGDGDTDDRVAIQACMDACYAAGGGIVYFPAGVYIVTKGNKYNPQRNCLDFSFFNNVHFRGAGIGASIIRRKAGSYPGDTHIFQCGCASNCSFEDLTLDGNWQNCTDGDEQRHGIYLGSLIGICENIWIHRCSLENMRGDGIYMIGAVNLDPTWYTQNIWVEECEFLNNERSGGAHQYGCHKIRYINNYFKLYENNSDQDLDFEASGDAPLIDLIVMGNIFDHQTGTLCIALGGPVSPMDHVVFCNNLVLNGHLFSQHTTHALIANNVFLGRDDAGDNSCVVDLRGQMEGLQFINNYVRSIGFTGDQEAPIRITNLGSSLPSQVKVCGNIVDIVDAYPSAFGILVKNPGHDVEVCDNIVNGDGSNAIGIGIVIAEDGLAHRNVKIDHNTIKNFASAAVFIGVSSPSSPLENASVCYNSIYDDQDTPTQTTGIVLDGNVSTWDTSQTLKIAENIFGRGITTQVDMRTIGFPYICIGGNGGPKAIGIYQVIGSPEGVVTAPRGALALRIDGGASTTLYVKTSGTGNTGWTAK